jgi:hypothetical protein
MNKLRITLLTFFMCFMFAFPARATEGTVNLRSSNGDMGSCFAASVWFEGRYRVLMTCRGLRSAIDPVKNRYVTWVKKGENLKRLGEVVGGKMRASVEEDFESMVITVETDSYVNKPTEEGVLFGEVKLIDFGSEGSVRGFTNVEEEKTVDEITEVTVTPSVVEEETTSNGVGGVFKTLGKALLLGFTVLLVVVGVLSYLSRRGKN